MSVFIAIGLGLGLRFGRMGALNKKHAGGGTPVAGTPTYYIYGF